jgi:hypothetical protein
MTTAIDQLRGQVRARIITAGDPSYDEARAVHNGMFDPRPRLIVQAEQVADVIAGVNFARDHVLELSVRGGGHSAPGFGTNDDRVVIDLGLLRHIPPRQRAGVADAEMPATMFPGWRNASRSRTSCAMASSSRALKTTVVNVPSVPSGSYRLSGSLRSEPVGRGSGPSEGATGPVARRVSFGTGASAPGCTARSTAA